MRVGIKAALFPTRTQDCSGSGRRRPVNKGRRSIAPERLLRALLLQMLYSVRSERMLMEPLSYNLLFRWFVGLSENETVWHLTVFTKNRDRLLEGALAEEFFSLIVKQRGAGICCRMGTSPWTAR
jgi:transposase